MPLAPHPERLRSRRHLKFVKTLRCMICGRDPPSDPHHLKFVQPRAKALKSGDQWTIPVCRRHHEQIEAAGDEAAWWASQGIDPCPLAVELWIVSQRAQWTSIPGNTSSLKSRTHGSGQS